MSEFLSALTVPSITELYNIFAKQSGTSTVKKFPNRRSAELRLQDISRGVKREVLVAALKKIKVPKEVIEKLPTTPMEIPPEAPAPAATSHTPPHSEKNPTLTKEEEKEKQRWEKEQTKEDKALRKDRRNMSQKAAIVLSALQRMIPVDAKGKKAEVDSTLVAKVLQTNTNFVCAQIEQLDRLGLVSYEDDSPDDSNKFYYISLTAGGRGLDVQKIVTEGDAASAPTEAPKVVVISKGKLPSENSGPVSRMNGKKLYKLVTDNPRRPGTHGHRSFSLIKDGMSYEAYKSAGGRNNDLAWDIDHKFVELRDK
jgi:ribosomal protein L12E/L44/L45/RPP1/RPP2